MLVRFIFLTTIACSFLCVASPALCQTGDVKGSLIGKSSDDDEERPKSFRETLVKMRIDKEKKEFEQMLDRGREALKLTEELEKAYASYGRLNSGEINKLVEVEKLVKKIRSELGGNDGDDDDEADQAVRSEQLHGGDLIKSFRETTVKLIDELKKTTRFTVSAAAIHASNSVLKLARILRISR